jgi:hypothetical protein
MKPMPHLLRAACLAGALLISSSAPAATLTWTGLGADDNLATGGNWDFGTPPLATDSATFTGFTRNAPVATAGVTYFTVLFDAGAGPFTFSGSALTTGATASPMGGGITNASSNPQVFNNAVSPRSGAMTASTEDLLFNGTFNVGNGGTTAGRHITNDGPRSIYYNTLQGSGTDSTAGGFLYRMGAGTTFLYGSSPSWNGRLVIRNGSVVVNNNNSLGSTTGTTLIESSGGGTVWDGRLVLSNNVTLPGELHPRLPPARLPQRRPHPQRCGQ